MLILGMDPGTATTGYGILQIKSNSFEVIDSGLIETNKDGLPEARLLSIYDQMRVIITKHKPDVVAIERIFFATNAKTAIAVGQALGVMLFCAAQQKVSIFQYAPATIKKTISGNGRADKKEMQKSLRKILGPHVKSEAHKKTHFDNTADALAIALTHVLKNPQ